MNERNASIDPVYKPVQLQQQYLSRRKNWQSSVCDRQFNGWAEDLGIKKWGRNEKHAYLIPVVDAIRMHTLVLIFTFLGKDHYESIRQGMYGLRADEWFERVFARDNPRGLVEWMERLPETSAINYPFCRCPQSGDWNYPRWIEDLLWWYGEGGKQSYGIRPKRKHKEKES